MLIRSTVSSKDVSEDRFIHEGKCQEHDEHSASYMDQFYDTHMVFSEVVMNSLKNKKRSVRCIKKFDFIRHAQMAVLCDVACQIFFFLCFLY